ncbi:MAG TPA: glycosyltransferase [Bacteroidia bacterium]|jgi:GT2 family glycosyltransferase|nr:glycosyltransferase [Bacteroidia bacterium]
MPELSIIIPTKDRGAILRKTYERVIECSSHLDREILIINNSLTPLTLPLKPENVIVKDNPNNKDSVFSSRNYGASIASSPILLFVDDDILVTKESLDYAMNFQAERTSACLNVNWEYPRELMQKVKRTIFGRYLIKHGFTAMKTLYHDDHWRDNELFISPSLASFFFCIRKDDFKKIGGYDERHLHEGTDIDISNRLNSNGIKIWINPVVMVYHNEEDRIEIGNWLERKKRLGEIHGHSKNMPEITHQLHYSFIKKNGFAIVYAMQPILLLVIKLLDSFKLDFPGFFLIDALLGANMCHGYYSAEK